MKIQPKMWPARGERTAKVTKKAKGLPVGKAEDDMLPRRGRRPGKVSEKMNAMKGKPGKFKPGSKDKPSFVRG